MQLATLTLFLKWFARPKSCLGNARNHFFQVCGTVQKKSNFYRWLRRAAPMAYCTQRSCCHGWARHRRQLAQLGGPKVRLGDCGRNWWPPARITDSPWAVTPSLGTAAGMSIIPLVLFFFPLFFFPFSVSSLRFYLIIQCCFIITCVPTVFSGVHTGTGVRHGGTSLSKGTRSRVHRLFDLIWDVYI